MKLIHAEVVAAAPPAAVFARLRDTARWPDWAPMDEGRLLEEAPGGDPEGVGALRRFTTGRTTSIERVVAYEPDRHLAYVLVEGLPLRDYRADVTLDAVPEGTRISWHSTFRPRWPGTGWIYQLALGRFLRRVTRDLAADAARVAAAPTSRDQLS